MKSRHIPILDPLRGLAALAVCLFHFSCGNREYLSEDDAVRWVGSFGWLGVESFFAISGFVIPYSLYARGEYRLSDAGPFFLRRLKRLEPPYFACIAMVLGLQWLSAQAPGFRGEAFPFSLGRILAHAGYLNAVLDYGWVNPVFWTLAIEAQFYIFVALIYPLLNHRVAAIRWGTIAGMVLAGAAGHGNVALLPHWLPIFALGMTSFQGFVGHVTRPQFFILTALVAGAAAAIVGVQEAVAGTLTGVVIVLAGTRPLPAWLNPLAAAGAISYSLYLVHVPIGGRVINLVSRLPNTLGYRYAGILAAFVVSGLAAVAFWWLVERPSQRWASGRSLRKEASTAEAVTARNPLEALPPAPVTVSS
jgi:peptidoglycan/LPS O-acetylase OafA/YrhL